MRYVSASDSCVNPAGDAGTASTARVPRVALVGVTGYAGLYVRHLSDLHDRGEIELRDAVVVNPVEAEPAVRALEGRGVRVHRDLDALCREAAPDWICLPVGIPAHRDLTVRALETGADVLLEKPAAGCVADWRTMREAEAGARGRVWIGFQHLHDRKIRELKQELVAGEWGVIRSIRIFGRWPRGDHYYGRNRWVGRRWVDGMEINDSPIQNAFAHQLNLALFLAGSDGEAWAEAMSVSGCVRRIRPGIETFDSCKLRYELDGGIPLEVDLKHACRETVNPVVRLETSTGWVELRAAELRGENHGRTRMEPVCEHPHADMFRDTVLEEGPGCTLDQAGAHVRAVQLVTDRLVPEPVVDARRDPDTTAWFDPVEDGVRI